MAAFLLLRENRPFPGKGSGARIVEYFQYAPDSLRNPSLNLQYPERDSIVICVGRVGHDVMARVREYLP